MARLAPPLDPLLIIEIQLDGENIEQVYEFKFLGLILDDKLTWAQHVNRLVSKLHSSLFVMNRIKSFVPNFCLRMLYFAHFHMQKSAVKTICKKGFRDSSGPCFNKTEILRLEQQLELNSLKSMFKVFTRTAPLPIVNMYQSSKRRDSRTNNFIIKKHSTSLYNNSFICKDVTLWNDLSLNEKLFPNIKCFSKFHKTRLLNLFN